ncbi:MarR family transcriptional regulator [Nocardia brasiliensis]|uniref:MarR family transcriptional regulator n=1 Tax=Nocardia brasiliensis TaxID=37326 RepID=UPI0033C73D70
MALTEREAQVLGVLSPLDIAEALTVREIRARSGLAHTTTARALDGLRRGGFVRRTERSPATWRATDQGRITGRARGYREYATEVTRRGVPKSEAAS